MSSSYLPTSELTDLLPTSHGLSAGQLASCITFGSEFVDSALAHLYWVPFTTYAASPAASPPYIVRRAAAYFAAAEAYLLMREVLMLTDDGGKAEDARKYANDLLAPFVEGKQQLPPETLTEVLTTTDWGDGDPYTSDQSALSCSNCEVIAESPRFTGTDWQLGYDFSVDWHAGTHKWVITRFDSDIGVAAGTEGDPGDTLTYEVTRIKKREVVLSGVRSAEILRG